MNIRLNDDELRLIRSARSGAETEMSDDEFARGLAAFERTIEASSQGSHRAGSQARRSRRRRRGLIWTGAGVVAVGALAGVALVATPAPVLSPVLGPATPKESHAEAVELLQRAADEALADGTELQPGQYLKRSCRVIGVTFPSTPETLFEGQPPTVWERRSMNTANYFPADDSDDHVVRTSPEYGTEAIAGDWPDEPEGVPYDGKSALNPGEYFEMRVPADQASPGFVVPDTAAQLQDVALKQWEEMQRQDVEYSEDQALPNALLPYFNDTMPQEIRAEAFRLLSEQPGVRSQEFSGNDAELGIKNTEGRIVSFEIRDGHAIEMIFDVKHARLIGTRNVLTAPDPSTPGLEIGEVLNAIACTASVVDEIPDIETWK